jgi:hypothetical protein
MSRILVPITGHAWYDRLNAVGYYSEKQLEQWIQQHVHSLFPDHFVFPFKKDVASKSVNKTNRPDLAIINRDFTAWGMVEVELSRHPIKHVLEQTETFRNGTYNSLEIAEYSQKQLNQYCRKNVTKDRLVKLFRSKPPTILVIADAHSVDWETLLAKKEIGLCVFEVFKDTRGRYVFRTFGQFPYEPADSAHCKPAALPNMLQVVGSFTFTKLPQNKEINISFNGQLTRWAVLRENAKRYLRFLGDINPLSATDTYALIRDKRNAYYFIKN